MSLLPDGIPDLQDAFEPFAPGDEPPPGLVPPTADVKLAPVTTVQSVGGEPGQRKEKPKFVPGNAPGDKICW